MKIVVSLVASGIQFSWIGWMRCIGQMPNVSTKFCDLHWSSYYALSCRSCVELVDMTPSEKRWESLGWFLSRAAEHSTPNKFLLKLYTAFSFPLQFHDGWSTSRCYEVARGLFWSQSTSLQLSLLRSQVRSTALVMSGPFTARTLSNPPPSCHLFNCMVNGGRGYIYVWAHYKVWSSHPLSPWCWLKGRGAACLVVQD